MEYKNLCINCNYWIHSFYSGFTLVDENYRAYHLAEEEDFCKVIGQGKKEYTFIYNEGRSKISHSKICEKGLVPQYLRSYIPKYIKCKILGD